MSGALTKYFGQALGKQSLMEALRAGGWKVLLDGNLAEQLVEHGPGGELKGVDKYGNKYFEKVEAQSNRHRWVVYSKADDWRAQDPSAVPPEWHGWLHHITDECPVNKEFETPIYAIPARVHPTMTAERYMPKGSWSNPDRRSWRRVQAWEPPAARGTH